MNASLTNYRLEDVGCVSKWSPYWQSIDGRTLVVFQGKGLLDRASMGGPQLCFKVKASLTKYQWDGLGCVSRWRSHR